MARLDVLFEHLRERRYLKNVTPKTITWYETAFLALTRTVKITDPADLTKPMLQDFLVRLQRALLGTSASSANPSDSGRQTGRHPRGRSSRLAVHGSAGSRCGRLDDGLGV